MELETLIAVLEHTPITEEDFTKEFVGEAMASLHNTTIRAKEAWEYRVKRDKEEEARIAEEKRLAVIREEQKVEADRLAKVAEEQASEKLIADGIRAQEEEALTKGKQKLQEAQDALDAEKREDQAQKDRVALAKKMEAEALIKAEENLKDKAARETEQKALAAKMQPDKDKVAAFVEDLEAITPPKVTDEAIGKILFFAQKGLGEVIRKIIEDLEKL